MAKDDLAYGFELLAGAVARGADGIAATNDGGRKAKQRIVRALVALEAAGLAVVVRAGSGVVGAQLTSRGLEHGATLRAGMPAPSRMPGDVLDVVLVREGDLG